MEHDNISYAKRTKIFGIMIFIVLSMLILISFTEAVEIKYSDSYLSKNTFTTKGYSAGDVDSIKDMIKDKESTAKKDTTLSKYPKVEITEDKLLWLFGGDPIMDIELMDHTEFCTIDCYSILNVNIQKKTNLIDELETRSFIGSSLEYTNNIETNIYVLTNVSYPYTVPIMTTQCRNITLMGGVSRGENGVLISYRESEFNFTECNLQETGEKETKIEIKEEFVKYNNEELEPGNYIVKITGKKNNFYEVIDWVPTIKNEKIEAFAWWNITEPYGNGSLGDIYFSTTTKIYGNMTNGVDYTVTSNTLYLRTDRYYNFNSFYLGAGTTLATQNTSGAVIYILAKVNMTILGTIDLSAKLNPGQQNATSFSYLGDSFTTPSVANGGSGYGPTTQGLGFGGGSYGNNGIISGCSSLTSGYGANGGYPFGNGGGGQTVVSTNDGCVQVNGINGTRSGGGGGAATARDDGGGGYFGCTITAISGGGGNSYGGGGGAGDTTGTHASSWNCWGGAVANGGGGAGGSAGRPGLNLVLRSNNMTLNGATGSINLAGTSGTNGGNGGTSNYGVLIGSTWTKRATGCGGYGGGGGGGANSGSIKVYYRYLTNSTIIPTLVNTNKGYGGAGGINGAYAPDCSTYTSPSGSNAASNGTITLYNEGFTETYLNYPINASTIIITPLISFSATIIPYSVTLVNTTLYLWNATGLYTNTTTLGGTSAINVTWTRDAIYMPEADNYIWGVKTCYTDGALPFCVETVNNTFNTRLYTILSESYNSSTYETASEIFQINLTSEAFGIYGEVFDIKTYLIYNGIPYISNKNITGDIATFTRTLDIDTVSNVTNKSWYWNILMSGTNINSTSKNQTVSPITFTICNSTINNTFINYTYKDEMQYYYINASVQASSFNYWLGSGNIQKNYFYNTAVENISTGFCFTPSNRTITANYIYQPASLEYITRTFNSIDNITLSNTSTNKLLYLILSFDSDPVTIQVVDLTSANVISGARVTITRDIQGTTVTVFDGYTDSAGTVSAFLSSIASYTITAVKSGCGSNTQTITPVGSYTMSLNCASNLTEYVSFIDGITYQRTPATGVANTPGTIDFGYYVSSSIYPMLAAKFELYDLDGTYLTSNETNVSSGFSYCNSSSCLLTINYYTASGDNIKGRYYVKIGNSTNSTWVLLEKDAYWRYIFINTNNSQQAWKKATLHFNDFMNVWTGGNAQTNCIVYHTQADCTSVVACKWVNATSQELQMTRGTATGHCILRDDLNKMEFNRVLIIFFGLVVIMFIMGRGIGYEMTNPGSFVAFLSIVIVILSAGGAFTFSGLTPWEWFNQYIYAYICVMFAAGYNLSIIRRYSA